MLRPTQTAVCAPASSSSAPIDQFAMLFFAPRVRRTTGVLVGVSHKVIDAVRPVVQPFRAVRRADRRTGNRNGNAI